MIRLKYAMFAAPVLLAVILAACAPTTPVPTMEPTEPAPTATEPEPTATEPQPTPTEAPPTETAEPETPAPTAIGEEALISRGEELFIDNCSACHQENGQGAGIFPALAGNPFVTGDPGPPIRRVILGRGAMPGFGNFLSNQEIAAIASYIRNAWTNEAPVVMPEEVQAMREEIMSEFEETDKEPGDS